MYASTSSVASAAGRALSGMYQRVGVETGIDAATPHRLVAMLFDGFIESIARARGAMRDRNAEAKGRAITRAVRIVDEGLKAALDRNAGGTLANDLSDLYDYVVLRLTQANLHNDEAVLDECQRLLEPVRDAWAQIGPQAAEQAR